MLVRWPFEGHGRFLTVWFHGKRAETVPQLLPMLFNKGNVLQLLKEVGIFATQNKHTLHPEPWCSVGRNVLWPCWRPACLRRWGRARCPGHFNTGSKQLVAPCPR